MIAVPGSRVGVDCIYSKNRGTPGWSWSGGGGKEYRTVAEEDNYRLVLDNVGLEVNNKGRCQKHPSNFRRKAAKP